MHLKVIVAVLQVCAKCGQQFDAARDDFFGIFLLQVSKAKCSVRLSLERHRRNISVPYWLSADIGDAL